MYGYRKSAFKRNRCSPSLQPRTRYSLIVMPVYIVRRQQPNFGRTLDNRVSEAPTIRLIKSLSIRPHYVKRLTFSRFKNFVSPQTLRFTDDRRFRTRSTFTSTFSIKSFCFFATYFMTRLIYLLNFQWVSKRLAFSIASTHTNRKSRMQRQTQNIFTSANKKPL